MKSVFLILACTMFMLAACTANSNYEEGTYNSVSELGDVAGDEQTEQKYDIEGAMQSQENSVEIEPEITIFEELNLSITTPEEGAKRVYQVMFADKGYSAEVCYNAKGNLYLQLGGAISDVQNEDERNRFTLVYDRISANGKCYLYVHYMEHLSPDGSNDAIVILDMYAVDMQTGVVIEADKQNWNDLGTDQYRVMTGE